MLNHHMTESRLSIITRTTAQVAATLTAQQLADVEALASEFAAIRAEHPHVKLPPSPVHCYLMEQVGKVWNLAVGQYEDTDLGIAYRPTAKALALIAMAQEQQ